MATAGHLCRGEGATRSEPRRFPGHSGGGGKGGGGGEWRGGGHARHGRDHNDVVIGRRRGGRVRQRTATPAPIVGSRQGGFCLLLGQYEANRDQEAAEELDCVMDSGINRKVANEVPLYLHQASGASGRIRFETATNAERAFNLRFKYASRRLRVTHIHPGYAICGRSAGRAVLVWCGRCSCGVGAIKALTQREPWRYSLIRTSLFLCTAGSLYQKKRIKQR